MNLGRSELLQTHHWHPLGLLGMAAGLAGLLLLVAQGLQPAVEDARGLAPNPPAPVATRLETRKAELDERLARFPAVEQRAAQVAAIASLAAEHGVDLTGGEYRDTDSPMPQSLAVLEVRLPFQGPAEGLRGFVAGLQRELPWLAIERLRVEQSGSTWRGELQGRLF